MKELLKIIKEESLRSKKRKALGAAFAAMVLCLLLLAGCASNPAQKELASTHMNVGTAYIEAGDNSGALKELLQAEKLTPQDPKVHYLLAIAYRNKGYNEKAIEECKTAIGIKDDYSEAHNLLGAIYLNKNEYELALASFRKALANMLYDTPTVALYNMGRTYQLKGDLAKAMTTYQEAAAKDFRGELLPLIEHNMGKIYYDQGNIPKAVQHFKKSTDLAPSLVDSHYWLGECYLKEGRLKEAKKTFETIIQIAPDSEAGKRAQEKIKDISI